MKTHKIVKVDWVDSCNYRGWRDIDRAKESEPASCISCGILVKVKRGSIGVTHSMNDEDGIADTMVIPRKVIQKIEVVATFRK